MMKTIYAAIILIAFTGILFIGCTESPVSPVDQTVSLDKKGPVVHHVVGSGLLFFNGNNCGARYSARQYADGTFDGDYEINCANATGDPTFKLNGDIISFTVYENVNEFDGKMAVFLGQEKTGPYAGWYDVFFAIDNGQPGQAPAPDQVNNALLSLPTLEYIFWGMTIEEWAALSPADLITYLGIANCDQGNITVE
jgi:hypothetical protein